MVRHLHDDDGDQPSGGGVEWLYSLVMEQARSVPLWQGVLDRLAITPGDRDAQAQAVDVVAAMLASDAAFAHAVQTAASDVMRPTHTADLFVRNTLQDSTVTGPAIQTGTFSMSGGAIAAGDVDQSRHRSLRIGLGGLLAVVLVGSGGVVGYRLGAEQSSPHSGATISAASAQDGRSDKGGPLDSERGLSPYKHTFVYAKQVQGSNGRTINADVNAEITVQFAGFSERVADCGLTSSTGNHIAVFTLSASNLNPKAGDEAVDTNPFLDLRPIGGDRIYGVKEATPYRKKSCPREYPAVVDPFDGPILYAVPDEQFEFVDYTLVLAGVPDAPGTEFGFEIRLWHTTPSDEHYESDKAIFKS
ncbi:hypothetical protein [Saccharothrix variisporea]|nr:hypothetical protein [Saccharothrix variisporea]